MSCIRSIVAVSFLASIGVSTAVTAQEMISDTTARKQPLTTWGVQFEEFEYRYSDDDEELGREETTVYRGIAARLNFLSLDSPDLRFPVQQCRREMAKPTRGSWKRVNK